MKELAFGIDFGTTNSLLSVWGSRISEGRKLPLPLYEDGVINRPHPSFVWYQLEAPPIVGSQAKSRMAEEQNATGNTFVRSIKRDLGKNKKKVIQGAEPVDAWRVAGEIFKHLRANGEQGLTEQRIESSIEEAVVSIPVHFDGRARRDLRMAMREAGMNLVTFVHEPFAALLAHFYDPVDKLQSLRGKRALVFDWGGGTLDICLVAVSENGREIVELGRSCLNDLAGDEFDKQLMRDVRSRFLNRMGIDPDRFVLEKTVEGRFWSRCENAKIELSELEESDLIVPSFWSVGGHSINLDDKLTREHFERLIGNFLDRAIAAVDLCLGQAGIDEPTLVDEVIMVGGSSNIPAIRRRMIEKFGSRVSVVKNPEAAISRGAAIVAAENWKPFAARSVSVQLCDNTYFPILQYGQELAQSASREFSFFCVDPRSGQANFLFHEREDENNDGYRRLPESLSIPIKEHLESLEQLKRDRILCRFSISEDLTLECQGRSASLGQDGFAELHDICFGLKLD